MTKYNEHNLTPAVISEMIAFEKEVDYHFGQGETKGSVKVKNTARHQFVALTIFANSLGYVQNEDEVAEGKLGSCFYYLGGKTKRKVVGFNTMCTWYNTCFMPRFNHG
ncbi:MAG: hypothetical protein GY951_13195, partial [Psychromonas sp.]|nr:hypothetical protein [Psychromonas sp.]